MDAEGVQVVSGKLALDHSVRVGPRQPALPPDQVEQAFLHPLQVMRLEEKALLPMDSQRHMKKS